MSSHAISGHAASRLSQKLLHTAHALPAMVQRGSWTYTETCSGNGIGAGQVQAVLWAVMCIDVLC